jgi:hypothetical protein
MSTRATYHFADEYRDVTFYIHHDGYPSGAAHYFQNMLNHEDSMESCNHGLAEVFFRANERAEFTKSHEAHGDTEYRYDVGTRFAKWGIGGGGTLRFDESIRQIVAYERKSYDSEQWTPFFTGTVEEFVQKYARAYA